MSQVAFCPGGGACSKMQRKQGVALFPPAAVSQAECSCRGMRQDRIGHAHRTDRTAIDKRYAVLHGAIIGQVAGLEVVEPIDHDVRAIGIAFDIPVVDVIDDRRDVYLRIDPGDLAFRRLRFGDCIGNIPFVEQHLPLQVGELDEVAINDDQVPNPGPGQQVCSHGTERPAAKNERGGAEQFVLPLYSETGQKHLAVITVQVVRHRWFARSLRYITMPPVKERRRATDSKVTKSDCRCLLIYSPDW